MDAPSSALCRMFRPRAEVKEALPSPSMLETLYSGLRRVSSAGPRIWPAWLRRPRRIVYPRRLTTASCLRFRINFALKRLILDRFARSGCARRTSKCCGTFERVGRDNARGYHRRSWLTDVSAAPPGFPQRAYWSRWTWSTASCCAPLTACSPSRQRSMAAQYAVAADRRLVRRSSPAWKGPRVPTTGWGLARPTALWSREAVARHGGAGRGQRGPTADRADLDPADNAARDRLDCIRISYALSIVLPA